MRGKLDAQEIEMLIKSQLIGRIGCHRSDFIYVVPISYAYEDPYIYGYTFEGMKTDMMRANPDVCFEVDDTRDLSNWKSVIAWGKFEELKDPEERDMALQVLNKRVLPIAHSETMRIYSWWPFSIDNAEKANGVFFRIHLQEKTGRFESSVDKYFYAT